jgi:uncharacterized membrane protein (UPF0127 family)
MARFPRPALPVLLLAMSGLYGLPEALAMPFATCPEGTVTLLAGRSRACAEVASTEAQRERGLMFRDRLAADGGMLFVFPAAERHQMWMKNTFVALSVAFIDERGNIINIEDMLPRTLDAHGARLPARYALEMPYGWFGRRSLGPGAHLDGLPAADLAR